MFQHKKTYNPNQFIPKTNDQTKGHLSSGLNKNNTKLSYDEIRKIVLEESGKGNSRKPLDQSPPQIKNKFNIV